MMGAFFTQVTPGSRFFTQVPGFSPARTVREPFLAAQTGALTAAGGYEIRRVKQGTCVGCYCTILGLYRELLFCDSALMMTKAGRRYVESADV